MCLLERTHDSYLTPMIVSPISTPAKLEPLVLPGVTSTESGRPRLQFDSDSGQLRSTLTLVDSDSGRHLLRTIPTLDDFDSGRLRLRRTPTPDDHDTGRLNVTLISV